MCEIRTSCLVKRRQAKKATLTTSQDPSTSMASIFVTSTHLDASTQGTGQNFAVPCMS